MAQNPGPWHYTGSSNQNMNTSTSMQDPQNAGGNMQESFKTPTLTQDEIRVIKECNRESFYYRCIPLSTLFSGLAYIAMKNGYLRKSPSYGYGPKMFMGIFLGYFGGKISYQNVTAERLMQLPNSRLGEALRRRRGQQTFQESVNEQAGFVVRTPSSEFPREVPVLEQRPPDLSDHDEGADSFDKVTESLSEYSLSDEERQQGGRNFVSYSDLRKENRDEYNSKMAERYKRQTPEPSQPTSVEPPSSFMGSSDSLGFPPYREDSYSSPPTSKSPQEPHFNPKRNKYGDVWDN